MASVIVERTIPIASDRRAAGRIVSDTERLNRAAGLGRLELEPIDGRGAARYLVKTISGGFPLRYEERPFEWIDCRLFAVRARLVFFMRMAPEADFTSPCEPAMARTPTHCHGRPSARKVVCPEDPGGYFSQ